MTRLSLFLALLLGLPAQPPSPPTPDELAHSLATPLVRDLQAFFDTALETPDSYGKRVKRECRDFPEGDLFPYLFPAYAYANLARAGRLPAATARQRVATLLRLARPAVVQRLRPPHDDLTRLADYGHHATYLCQYGIGLGLYRQLGGEDLVREHDHIAQILAKALARRAGKPLRSFPSTTWPFDTIPCLLALHLHDQATNQSRTPALARAHFAWVDEHATDPDTGLPWSRIDNDTGASREQPRGCDLSLRILFLSAFAPDRAHRLYQAYTRHFWLDRVAAAGFAEWPHGRERFSDMDSGPIFLGLGTAATAMGLGATRTQGDTYRTLRILAQVPGLRRSIAALTEPGPARLAGTIELRTGYVSGFLFGDAVLFFVLTWLMH